MLGLVDKLKSLVDKVKHLVDKQESSVDKPGLGRQTKRHPFKFFLKNLNGGLFKLKFYEIISQKNMHKKEREK